MESLDAECYEPPTLVAVGEFSEDTLGFGSRYTDIIGEHV
ncbi:lasso RiPP family leader peptide-containing protein [Streptomyces botrytidirepellens]|uniref:Lasso RiPP family leader peptide-containing protein n=1 Tax=Streptomyces botrytidirepellens TaxID=2486417 RepID=A0A3M8SPR7_9ACTN|nr:lasso RiPP family leader peptide-containing protein [Streptomyces botrytidirepellens]RNF82783.1 lasso RiPP family leader peptide-containing protein [Streptomyces botrytidirepellens]